MKHQTIKNESVLKATSVKKYLGEGVGQILALKGVDIELIPGELTLLMGPSGSGKTTLLSIMGCILTPTEGELVVAGKTATGMAPEALAKLRRENIGFVFQSYNLFPTLTARENVMLAMDVQGMSTVQSSSLAIEALETVGLESKLNNYPKQLSGGEQQRVAVARAIVGSPKVMLADEPTAALDSKNGQAVMTLLARIAHEKNSAVLAVTHDPRTEPYADRIIRIEDGLIQSNEKRTPELGGVDYSAIGHEGNAVVHKFPVEQVAKNHAPTEVNSGSSETSADDQNSGYSSPKKQGPDTGTKSSRRKSRRRKQKRRR